MPIQAQRDVEPPVQPLTPDGSDSVLGDNPVWWRDGRRVRRESKQPEGNIPVECTQYRDAEVYLAAIEQAEQIAQSRSCRQPERIGNAVCQAAQICTSGTDVPTCTGSDGSRSGS